MDQPEDRHNWSKKINAKLVQLEREVFLAGCERAFLLFMDSCCFCKACAETRETCQEPQMPLVGGHWVYPDKNQKLKVEGSTSERSSLPWREGFEGGGPSRHSPECKKQRVWR